MSGELRLRQRRPSREVDAEIDCAQLAMKRGLALLLRAGARLVSRADSPPRESDALRPPPRGGVEDDRHAEADDRYLQK